MFLYGFLGAFVLLSLLTAGVALGWQGHKLLLRYRTPVASPPEQAELQRMQESQRAFRQLTNYSAECAYGLTAETMQGGDDT